MNVQPTSIGNSNMDFWLSGKTPSQTQITPKETNDSVYFTSGLNEDLKINKEKSIAGPVLDGILNDKRPQ